MSQPKTFEEWLNNLPIQTLTDELKEDILEKFEEEKIEFAKFHVKKALEQASKKALLLVESNWGRYEDKPDNPDYREVSEVKNNKYGHGDCTYEIITPSKNSILNAYPEKNIQ